MASIIPFIPPAVFDDAAATAMGEAFDAACKVLNVTGQSQLVVQDAIARRIIAAARKGERDVNRLRDVAVAALTNRPHAVDE
jgi:hypothetical protein